MVVTADYAGTFDPVTLPAFEGRLLTLATDPGTPAPQGSYDVTILDQYGHDVLEGVGANRSATNTEKAVIVYSGTILHPVVGWSDTLALTLTGNNVTGAETTVTLCYALGV